MSGVAISLPGNFAGALAEAAGTVGWESVGGQSRGQSEALEGAQEQPHVARCHFCRANLALETILSTLSCGSETSILLLSHVNPRCSTVVDGESADFPNFTP